MLVGRRGLATLSRMRLSCLLFVCWIWVDTFVAASTGNDCPWGITPSWRAVDPDFNWNKRRTGISKQWTSGLALWSHFNATELEQTHPQPWTSGYMVKFLKQVNESAFELYSVYEEDAVGLWLKGEGFLGKRKDGLLDQGYLFTKTPYRIARLPARVPEPLKQKAALTRATIVQPDAATFSGPRWLPSVKQLRKLDSSEHSRFQFCEMWLSETLDGRPEACKMGLFCMYNGISGELEQVFRIREMSLPKNLALKNPRKNVNLQKLEPKTRRQHVPWTYNKHLESDAAMLLLRGDSMQDVLDTAGYTCFQGRAVRVPDTLDGPEVDFTLSSNASIPVYYSPADIEPEKFFHCRFSDGAYARIPKRFDKNLVRDRTLVGMEFGCIMQSGDFHRLLAVGSRREEGLHTTVYEKWSHCLSETPKL